MDFRLQDKKVGVVISVGKNNFKIIRSARVSGGFSEDVDVDYADFDFYHRPNSRLYVRVTICTANGACKEHDWKVATIINGNPSMEAEKLRRIKEFLPFAKSLGIAATCLAHMIKGIMIPLTPHSKRT
ncbi:MAG: hypothetical protein ABSE76_02585 [Minisyncoccia bacterium]|jgi:hypothetical protein